MDRLRSLSRVLRPGALTLLRLVTGFILAVHGWQKLDDFASWRESLASMGVPAPELFGALSLAAELGGGVALMLGLFTPLAALAIFVNMLVAIFAVHLEGGLLASNNGFEYPLTLAAVAFYFFVRGAGPISLDHLIFARRGEREERPPSPFRHPARA